MSSTRNTRKVEFSPEQKAEHLRVQDLFKNWHPTPEELIGSDEGERFLLSGEYPYLRPFLARLKGERESAGLSLSDVARRCGIDKAALSRLENGQNPNPTLDTLWRYAAALGKRLLLDFADIVSTRMREPSRNQQKKSRKKAVRSSA